ncbi:MAG: four helix bundle protein [Saprospiraceae bacterium]
MAIQKFEDIIAWQKAQELAAEIYKQFGNIRDFGFRDQICRASVSISNNIAEGFDRGTNKEFIRFLYISSSSCSEVKSMLYLAVKLKLMEEKKAMILIETTIEISKIIKGLFKSMIK